MSRVQADEAGFSVIEMIVAILILAIIMGPLATTVILGLSSSEQAAQQTSNTTDQQLVASYFSNDAQSAATVALSDTSCGGTGTILHFGWVDPVGNVNKAAAYVVSGNHITRVSCQAGAVVQRVDIVNALGTPPEIKCDDAVCATVVGDPNATVTPVPRKVSMKLTVNGSDSNASKETYVFTVAGTRRSA